MTVRDEGFLAEAIPANTQRVTHAQFHTRADGRKLAHHGAVSSVLHMLADRDKPTEVVRLPNGTEIRLSTSQPHLARPDGYLSSYRAFFDVSKGGKTETVQGSEEATNLAIIVDAPAIKLNSLAECHAERVSEARIDVSSYVRKDGTFVAPYVQIRSILSQMKNGDEANFPDGIKVKQVKDGVFTTHFSDGRRSYGMATNLATVDHVVKGSQASDHKDSIPKDQSRWSAPKSDGMPKGAKVVTKDSKGNRSSGTIAGKTADGKVAVKPDKPTASAKADGSKFKRGDKATTHHTGGPGKPKGREVEIVSVKPDETDPKTGMQTKGIVARDVDGSTAYFSHSQLDPVGTKADKGPVPIIKAEPDPGYKIPPEKASAKPDPEMFKKSKAELQSLADGGGERAGKAKAELARREVKRKAKGKGGASKPSGGDTSIGKTKWSDPADDTGGYSLGSTTTVRKATIDGEEWEIRNNSLNGISLFRGNKRMPGIFKNDEEAMAHVERFRQKSAKEKPKADASRAAGDKADQRYFRMGKTELQNLASHGDTGAKRELSRREGKRGGGKKSDKGDGTAAPTASLATPKDGDSAPLKRRREEYAKLAKGIKARQGRIDSLSDTQKQKLAYDREQLKVMAANIKILENR